MENRHYADQTVFENAVDNFSENFITVLRV